MARSVITKESKRHAYTLAIEALVEKSNTLLKDKQGWRENAKALRTLSSLLESLDVDYLHTYE